MNERTVSLEELLKSRPKGDAWYHLTSVQLELSSYRSWANEVEAFLKQHKKKMAGLRKLRNNFPNLRSILVKEFRLADRYYEKNELQAKLKEVLDKQDEWRKRLKESLAD